jgi:hypothetical protein
MALPYYTQTLLNKQQELLQRIVLLLNNHFLSNDTLKKEKGIMEMKSYLLIPSSLSNASKLGKFRDIAKKNIASPLLFSLQEKHSLQNFFSIINDMEFNSIDGINASIVNINMKFPQKSAPSIS